MSLKFNLTLTTVPVTLESNGKPTEYQLREMIASARDSYMDSLGDRMRIDANGKPIGIKKFDGMQADLLTRTLFFAEGPNNGKPVPRDVIQKWPASVTAELFKEAQRINSLLEKEKDQEQEAKNE